MQASTPTLGFTDHHFTWRGPIYHIGQKIYERLDRALSNDKWRVQFPSVLVKVLTRSEFSDHHHLLTSLFEHEANISISKFKFEITWLLEESYEEILNNNWKGHPSLEENLENLKHNIIDWKNYIVNNLHQKKRQIMGRLQGIQHAPHQNQGRFH